MKRRLYKSVNNKKIAGVCGGIAEYLDMDPTIVRLITALLILGWGTGLWIYIVAALVMEPDPYQLENRYGHYYYNNRENKEYDEYEENEYYANDDRTRYSYNENYRQYK